MKKTKKNAEMTAKETVKKTSEKTKTTSKNKPKTEPETKEVKIIPTAEEKDLVSSIVDKLKKDNKHKLEFQFIKLSNELRNALAKTLDIKSDFIVRKSKVNNLEAVIKEQIEFINEMKKTFKALNL